MSRLFSGSIFAAPVKEKEAVQTVPWIGIELELSSQHLSPFVEYIDFAELQGRFFSEVAKSAGIFQNYHYLKAQGQNLPPHIDVDQISRYKNRFEAVFELLPLVLPNFFDIISMDLKDHLLEGIEDGLLLAKPSFEKAPIARSNAQPNNKIAAQSGPLNITTVVRKLKPEIPTQPNGIFVPDVEIPVHAQMQWFWQKVNSRWKELSIEQRLQAVPWTELPSAAKAKLILALYSIN